MAETDYEQGEDQAQELKSLGAMLQARFLTYKDARKETENEWIKDLRQYSGQYEPEVIAKLNEAGARSKVYVGLTRTKVMAAYSRIVDLLFQTGDSFYGIEPTPRPRIDPMQALALRQQAIAEVVSLANPGQSGADPEMVKQIVMEREDELNEAVQDAEKEIAESAAEEMKVDIDDWLVEGGVDQKMKQSILEK